jgi:predicted transglutaminase-like cysteine proteinase
MRSRMCAALCAALILVAALPARAGNAEPFGLSSAPVYGEKIVSTWQEVRSRTHEELKSLASCELHGECTEAQGRFLAVAAAGKSRGSRRELVAFVNQKAIYSLKGAPTPELLDAASLSMASPLQTFEKPFNSCWDYAILLYAALHVAGIPDDDLRLVIVRDLKATRVSSVPVNHAFVAVRTQDTWLIANEALSLFEESDFEPLVEGFAGFEGSNFKRYELLYLLDENGVRSYIRSIAQN